MRDKVENAINSFYEYCSKFSRLAIYGAGDVGRMVAEFMEKENIPFSCFCVTGKSEKNMLDRHEIKGIDEVMDFNPNTGIIVAVSKKNVNDILCLLDNRKITYFYSTEFLFQLFKRKCQESTSKVLILDNCIHRISDMKFDRNTVYICCPASIGDTLYAAAFVKAYKEEILSVQKVCLILKQGHRELGRLFPAVDEILVSDEIVEILDQYSLYTQTWKLKNYIYGHFKKSLRFEYYLEYGQEACRTILPRYRGLIMNLSTDAEPEKIIQPKNIIREKSGKREVIIMPYAKTAKMLPDAFWEVLVKRLMEQGYYVYTNVGSKTETAIQGTTAIKESLLNTASFCENCTAVISLRSGLCDLLGFTETKLIIINTSEELSVEWNLKDVFCRDGIYNVNCFGHKKYDKEIHEIMEIVG